MRCLMEEARSFVQQVYYPDVLAIAAAYREWCGVGAGVTNYLAVPEFPQDTRSTRFGLAGGIISNGDLQNTRVIKDHRDDYVISNIQESVARAWYEGADSLHP
jgi:hydrogenase large subunit